MPALKTPFLGAFYQSRSTNQADEQCVNVFLELDEERQGKAPAYLMMTPGLTFLTLLTASGLPNYLQAENGQVIFTENGNPILT